MTHLPRGFDADLPKEARNPMRALPSPEPLPDMPPDAEQSAEAAPAKPKPLDAISALKLRAHRRPGEAPKNWEARQ